jgi:hypothetical protein
MAFVMLAVRRAMPQKRSDRFDVHVTDGPLRLGPTALRAREGERPPPRADRS